MSGAHNFPGVAVGVCVVTDSAVAVEGVFRRDGWGFVVEKQTGAGEEDAVEEVAAGDGIVQAESIMSRH